MEPVFVKLPLLREKKQFHACFSLIQGELGKSKQHLEKLHPKEKEIYQNYKYNLRKESYLLGRLSAKQAILGLTSLNSAESIWIDAGVFLFPIVKGTNLQNIQVSISHCDNIGFSVAYPEAHPVGLDVEKINNEQKEIILSQLTKKEKKLLQQKTKCSSAEYTAIFSIKEALSKILKTGMMLDFKFLEIEKININSKVFECTFTHFKQYKAFSYIKNNYVFSIALPKRTKVDFDKITRLINSI